MFWRNVIDWEQIAYKLQTVRVCWWKLTLKEASNGVWSSRGDTWNSLRWKMCISWIIRINAQKESKRNCKILKHVRNDEQGSSDIWFSTYIESEDYTNAAYWSKWWDNIISAIYNQKLVEAWLQANIHWKHVLILTCQTNVFSTE